LSQIGAQKFLSLSVFRIWDPVLLRPWIRDPDPGWEKIRIRNEQPVSYFRFSLMQIKIRDQGPFRLQIRDPGWKNLNPGSRTIIFGGRVIMYVCTLRQFVLAIGKRLRTRTYIYIWRWRSFLVHSFYKTEQKITKFVISSSSIIY
jgi:hypothetical protein